MANQATIVLRQAIRSATDFSATTDRELLRQFAELGDQAAFAALVRRHCGLVLGVCRRALSHLQDAEDACQATFVILARKAGATRWQPSVANWLYATARRVAGNANVAAKRRARRERRAAVPEAVPPVDRMTGRELLAALDRELDRLPPIYREPLVLCYLEGLTHDETAARLGIAPATLKVRIHRGRKRLHAGLAKSGTAIGAGLLALAATSPAGASPPRLTDAILSAVAGKPSLAVAELAKGVAVNGIVSRMTVAAVAAVGVLVIGLGFASMSPIAAKPQKPAPANADSKTDKPQKIEERTIAGRVVAADGKLVVAELSANWIEGKPESLGRTKADGSFQVTVPLKGQGGWLAATADGYGVEFVSLRTEVRSPVTLTLPVAQPIRGRAIDPQGKPLAGLRVTVDDVTCYDGDALEKHLKRWTDEFYAHGIPPGGDRSMWYRSNNPGNRQTESPIFAITDADGKFTVKGVGAGQLFGLKIHGAGVADTSVTVMNRRGFNPKPYLDAATEAAKLMPGRRARYSQLYGPEPQIIVEREKLIRGTVTARDTGKPLAGIMVATLVREPLAYPSISEAVTDRDGRYEIHGVRKVNRYAVEFRTDPNTGYFPSMAEMDDTAGYEPIVVNLECAKGIIVNGTVKDKATGEPLSVRVSREAIPGNPFAKNYPAYNVRGEVISSTDGRFQFVTIPGPVAVMALDYKKKDGQIYRLAKPDPKYPDFLPKFADAKWCKVIETKETDRAVTVEIELEPAPRMAVKVVDAEGNPATGTHATGITQMDFNRPVHYPDTDTLTVYNVEPKQERLLAVVHAKRKLVGTAIVREADKDPVVKLGPGGTVTGRVTDADGKPIAGMKVKLYFTRREFCEASDPLNGENDARETMGRRETLTDASGEFRIEALFPAYEFRLTFMKGKTFFGPDYGKAVRHTIAKHGDTLKLGDLRLEPNEHNAE